MFLNKRFNTYTFSITGNRREYFAEKLKRLVHLAPFYRELLHHFGLPPKFLRSEANVFGKESSSSEEIARLQGIDKKRPPRRADDCPQGWPFC